MVGAGGGRTVARAELLGALGADLLAAGHEEGLEVLVEEGQDRRLAAIRRGHQQAQAGGRLVEGVRHKPVEIEGQLPAFAQRDRIGEGFGPREAGLGRFRIGNKHRAEPDVRPRRQVEDLHLQPPEPVTFPGRPGGRVIERLPVVRGSAQRRLEGEAGFRNRGRLVEVSEAAVVVALHRHLDGAGRRRGCVAEVEMQGAGAGADLVAVREDEDQRSVVVRGGGQMQRGAIGRSRRHRSPGRRGCRRLARRLAAEEAQRDAGEDQRRQQPGRYRASEHQLAGCGGRRKGWMRLRHGKVFLPKHVSCRYGAAGGRRWNRVIRYARFA